MTGLTSTVPGGLPHGYGVLLARGRMAALAASASAALVAAAAAHAPEANAPASPESPTFGTGLDAAA